MANALFGLQQGVTEARLLGAFDHSWHQRVHVLSLICGKPSAQTRKPLLQERLKSSHLRWPHATFGTLCSQHASSKGLSCRLCQWPLTSLQALASNGVGVTRTPLCRTQALKGDPAHHIKGNPEVAHRIERWPAIPDLIEAGPSNQTTEEQGDGFESEETCTSAANGSDRQDGKQTAAWFPVDPIWQATEQEALRDERLRQLLAPAWRILLLSDGSVTRHLQLLSDFGSVAADCFQMEEIGENLEGLPPGVELVPGPRVQRQVWLRTSDGQPLVYAASWWSSREVAGYLKNVQKPIWVNLSETRAELYRDVQRLYLGHSEELERAFGVKGPFWARHYVFYHDGRPLTLIYEVFSKSLERYIGPMQPADCLAQ